MAMQYEWQKKQEKELDERIRKRLMAYGTYVLLKWYVKYVKNSAEVKRYEYMGLPISVRMR